MSKNRFDGSNAEEKEFYEASYAQKRIYISQQLEKDSTTYNMSIALKLEGAVKKYKIEEVFNKLIARNEVLRTYFETRCGKIIQRIEDQIDFKVMSRTEKRNIDAVISEFIKPFDLSKAPLLRVELVESENKHYLLIDVHRSVSDDTSISVLIRDFAAIYNGEELEPLKLQYKDFSEWQNHFLKSDEIKKQEKFWLDHFNEEIPLLNLPLDYPRSSVQDYAGDSIKFKLSRELMESIRSLSKEIGTTVYMTLLSAINILLSKYTGQEDIIIGSTIAGRSHADLENILGVFVNTVAMRNNPESNKSYRVFLEEVRDNALNAYDNQDYQLEELIELLNLRLDMSRNPLFDVMFVMQNAEYMELKIEGLELIGCERYQTPEKFDLTFTAVEAANEIHFRIDYGANLFKEETIERMCKHLENILERITSNREIKLSEIDILTEEERNKILYEFNDTYAEYPRDKTIHQLFEEQVERTPENIALVLGKESMTYRELNNKSNQLARVLRNKGIKADEIVGIMVERSLEMIVGIMGILKAGGAYLPIDTEYPKDRVEYILKDSGAEILLTQSFISGSLEHNKDIVLIDDSELYKQSTDNLESISKPDNLAYIIYTSGTTGFPKGVQIQNNSLVNYINWFTNKADITCKDKTILLSSYAFDLGYTGLYPTLINGAELHITAKELYTNPDSLLDYIDKNNVTYIKLTPSLFNIVCNTQSFSKNNKMKSIRLLVSGGEEINIQDLKKTYSLYENTRIMNHYGPTETTIGTIAYLSTSENIKSFFERPTIGKPIFNAKAYILDKNNKIQPIGAAGELCIAGDGLARGYLNRPELTSEKFVDNPFEAEQKMYRTGDLARWLTDGNIEFLGRIDHQVKIRGYRVELGEIENKLLGHISISEAVVAARQDNNDGKYLCAYISGDRELTLRELREHLSKDLPDYMIPSYFVQLDKLPLTPNGKVDRNALPEPSGYMADNTEYTAPHNHTEEVLFRIWSEVLGKENVRINDNFFEQGGHSLKAIALTSRIYEELNKDIPLKELYKSPTIKGLSLYLESIEEEPDDNIEI